MSLSILFETAAFPDGTPVRILDDRIKQYPELGMLIPQGQRMQPKDLKLRVLGSQGMRYQVGLVFGGRSVSVERGDVEYRFEDHTGLPLVGKPAAPIVMGAIFN